MSDEADARAETTSAVPPINAEGDENGLDFDPKELSESPDNQTNILNDGRAAGPALTTDTTPGHAEQSTVADVGAYDMDEITIPLRGEKQMKLK